jgi:hypothetical protein
LFYSRNPRPISPRATSARCSRGTTTRTFPTS